MNINIKTCQTDSGKLKHHSLVILALALVGVIGSLGVTNSAQAQADTLYKSSFEQPTFNNGELLSGLDGWIAPPPLSPNAATITNTVARKSGSQSVVVPGALLDPSAGPFGPYAAIGSYRRPLGELGLISPTKSLARVDADLLLETAQPNTTGEFFSLTIAARSDNNETLGEVGLSSQGVVEAFAFNALGGGSPTFTKPIRFNKWYHITMLLDFSNRTTSYFINEHFLGSVPAPSVSNVLLRGAMVVYVRPDGDLLTGSNSVRSDYTARFDKFRISVHKDAPDID